MDRSLLDEMMSVAQMSEDELRVELAFMLYERGKVSMGWASDFARIGRVSFQRMAAARGLGPEYDQFAFDQDVAAIEAFDLASLAEEEARAEMAIVLYTSERLTIEQAARFARMDRMVFLQLLADRDIPMTLDVDDFEQEIATLRRLGRL